jgi:DNA sulfur modification protein DndE
MSAPLEHIRLSQQAKEQLIKLKRLTGIEHWNVLCRWAFCVSLQETALPQNFKIPADSNIEMTWKVFAGPYRELLMSLLIQRCQSDRLGTKPDVLANQFRLHLHRGVGYLAGNKRIRSIASMINVAISLD